jgi:5-methylcytosine-specific restriction endonuclease McrA
MLSWFLRQLDECSRSGAWPRVRREHLQREPACIACGRKKDLEVHHVVPYHQQPERELDAANLVTLCSEPCHIVHGHLMNWSHVNATVREDCAAYRAKMLQCGSVAEK